jgi:hypothetical protein
MERWRAFLARTALPPLWLLGLMWGAALGLEALRHREGWGVLACGAAILFLSGVVGATVGRSRRERLWLTLPCVLMLGSTVLQLSLMRSWLARSVSEDMYGALAQYVRNQDWGLLSFSRPKALVERFLGLPFLVIPGVILFAVIRKGLAGEGASRLELKDAADGLGFARFWMAVALLFLPFPGPFGRIVVGGQLLVWTLLWWRGMLRGPPSPALEARWRQQLVVSVTLGGLPLLLCIAFEAWSGSRQLGQDAMRGAETTRHLSHWLSLVWPILLMGLLVPVLKGHEGARRWALVLCAGVPLMELCLAALGGGVQPAGMMPVTLAGLAALGLAFLPLSRLRPGASKPHAP